MVDGSPSDSPAGKESVPRRTSFVRVLLVLAMTVVVLVGVRLAVPVLNPIFFAVVLALLFGPVYAWLDGVASPRRLRS